MRSNLFIGKLVNLKWYVNESEFYRYEPTDGSRNHVKLFKVKGVKIDVSIKRVIIYNSDD